MGERMFRDGQRAKLSDEAKRMLASVLGGTSIDCDVCGTVKQTKFGDYEFTPDDERFGGSHGTWRVEGYRLIAIDDSAEAPSVASPRKPRVGDKVRLTAKGLDKARNDEWFACDKAYVGMLGDIVSVTPSVWDYEVNFGKFSWFVSAEHVEPVASTPVERAYPAPRSTTVDEAKHGDDRPATNGEEFEATMLAHFSDADAERMLSLATTWALFPTQANQAIDLGLFAQRIKRRLEGQAA